MERTLDIIGTAAIAVVVLFVFSYANCVMLTTLHENTYAADPPRVLQFKKGWDCTRSVWLEYYLAPFR